MDSNRINTLKNDALDQSIALNKIVIDLLEERKKETHRLYMAFIALCLVFVVSVGIVCISAYQERKDIMQQLENTRIDFMEYLDSLEFQTTTTETTTDNSTTTVTQDSGEGDGNNIYQAGPDAVYNEGEGGE